MDDVSVDAYGINGKMSEFNAALGLLQLRYLDRVIERRRAIDQAYRDRLSGLKGIRCLGDEDETTSNYGYFPVLVEAGFPLDRDRLYRKFHNAGIYPRRYFYPLISEFPMYRDLPSANRDNLPVATAAALRVLCLPIYPDLPVEQVDRILSVIIEAAA